MERWESWGTEHLGNLPKAAQLIDNKAGIQNKIDCLF